MRTSSGIALCVCSSLVLLACNNPSPGPGESRDTRAAASPAPAAPGRSPSGEIVARYGSHVLTAEEVTVELERLPDRSRRMMSADGRKRFVENYILSDLLYDEGGRQGFANDPEIDRQVNDLRKRLVVQRVVRNLQNIPAVTDEEVQKYYEANKSLYSTTTIKARHILVKDEAQARDLLAKIKQNPSQFADLAKQYSTDTASASKGGDLGFFGHGRMVPDFERAAFALKNPGDVSDVVKTPYGYHIIMLDERKEGVAKPFDQVKEQIRATLRSQALQTRTQSFYDDLKKQANVTIDDATLEKVAALIPSAPAAGIALPGIAAPGASLPAGAGAAPATGSVTGGAAAPAPAPAATAGTATGAGAP
jgi:peptidyl-prolyl cis-trans isomerase C